MPVTAGLGCGEKITPDYTKFRFILKVFKREHSEKYSLRHNTEDEPNDKRDGVIVFPTPLDC